MEVRGTEEDVIISMPNPAPSPSPITGVTAGRPTGKTRGRGGMTDGAEEEDDDDAMPLTLPIPPPPPPPPPPPIPQGIDEVTGPGGRGRGRGRTGMLLMPTAAASARKYVSASRQEEVT